MASVAAFDMVVRSFKNALILLQFETRMVGMVMVCLESADCLVIHSLFLHTCYYIACTVGTINFADCAVYYVYAYLSSQYRVMLGSSLNWVKKKGQSLSSITDFFGMVCLHVCCFCCGVQDCPCEETP